MKYSTDRPFAEPRRTLGNAANYIMKLPASERKKRHWQTAAEMVLMAAENRGPMMQAHIGMLQALNHGKPTPETTPKRKPKRNTGSTGKDTKPM